MQPQGMITKLFPFQLRAVQWMVRREQEQLEDTTTTNNNNNNNNNNRKSNQIKGGILADEMVSDPAIEFFS